MKDRRLRVRGLFGSALYEASTVVAVMLILAGLIVYLSNRAPSPPARVTVEERHVPPGHRRIPPGQLRRLARVRVITLTPAVATRYQVRYREGALIVEVPSDRPVGLRRLDIVVAVNGHPVRKEEDLEELLDRYEDEREVELIVVRSGKLVPVRVALEDL